MREAERFATLLAITAIVNKLARTSKMEARFRHLYNIGTTCASGAAARAARSNRCTALFAPWGPPRGGPGGHGPPKNGMGANNAFDSPIFREIIR